MINILLTIRIISLIYRHRTIILVPYLYKQIEELGLQKDHKMVWLLDCWNVHTSNASMDWIKVDHPNILVIYVPTNYISKLQLANVILQKPLEHAFKEYFNRWTSQIIKEQIDKGEESKVEFRMSNLKLCPCEWLHST